ncbi:MAG: hypothetical protein AAF391_13955, partial [Bacteroidota bacterium]
PRRSQTYVLVYVDDLVIVGGGAGQTENEVVEKFGVSGIPTKFIIGKDNRIKFKSVGFSGNDEELVTEIKMMIEIAGGDGMDDLSGAP